MNCYIYLNGRGPDVVYQRKIDWIIQFEYSEDKLIL